jgi:hypothetical protein
MNLDDLKPQWQSYKEEIGKQSIVTERELSDMLTNREKATHHWIIPSRRTLLNACMSFLLMAMTGC